MDPEEAKSIEERRLSGYMFHFRCYMDRIHESEDLISSRMILKVEAGGDENAIWEEFNAPHSGV